MMADKNITVIGGGAIGGITAAWLVRQGFDLTVVDPWKEHRLAMIEGLEISGCRGEFKVPLTVIDPSDLKGPLDLVFLAVKSMHTEPVLRRLLPLLNEGSTLVSLQNSINEDRIAELIGPERTVGCVVGWGAITEGAGRLVQASPGEFVIGRLNGRSDEQLDQVRNILSRVTDTVITDNIYGFLWAKLLANCAISVGALQGKTVAEMVASAEARCALQGIVAEVLSVAAELGLTLETVNLKFEPNFYLNQKKFIAESLITILETTHGAILPTAYQDFLQNKPLETRYINGYVVEKGIEAGIRTPLNAALVKMMQEIEEKKRPVNENNIKELISRKGA
jgi:2-dehydropantoate 2-reductase